MKHETIINQRKRLPPFKSLNFIDSTFLIFAESFRPPYHDDEIEDRNFAQWMKIRIILRRSFFSYGYNFVY